MPFDPTPVTDWIQPRLDSGQVIPEVLDAFADLDEAGAYEVQQMLIQRRMSGGDRLIGYKAAMTSKAMREMVGLKEPVMGHLLVSGMLDASQTVAVNNYVKTTIEPEVAVILKHDLAGPGITRPLALAAIDGFAAAIEIGDIKTGDNQRSLQMTLVCNVMNGGQAVGSKLVSPSGIDLRVEGMVVRINGEVRGSATAAEVLGDPINSVVFIANKLGELGGYLQAGMLLMTGSIVRGIPVAAGDHVQVAFTRLGEVSLAFAA